MIRQEIWESKESYDIFFSPRRVPRDNYVPYHWHDAYEFGLELEGSFAITVKHKEYIIREGDIIAVNPMEIHTSRSLSGDCSITVIIPSIFFKKYAPNAPLPVFPNKFNHDQTARLRELLKRCNEKYELAQEENYLAFYSELFHFVDVLYEQRLTEVKDNTVLLSDFEKERLGIITDYIAKHYSEPLTLQDAAAVLHLQPNYFCRFFKKITGMSFLQYLNDFRVIRIYRDIIYTNDPIKDILPRHGFYDYKNFRQCFYRRYQCTPTEMRRCRTLSQFDEALVSKDALAE